MNKEGGSHPPPRGDNPPQDTYLGLSLSREEASPPGFENTNMCWNNLRGREGGEKYTSPKMLVVEVFSWEVKLASGREEIGFSITSRKRGEITW